MPESTDPQALLPLKPVELQLLLALGEGELHGYGLTQAIVDRTDGVIRLEPGNLYRVIRRLLAAGLLVEGSRREAPDVGSQRRRYYGLTALGERVLRAELNRLSRLVDSPEVRAFVARRAT